MEQRFFEGIDIAGMFMKQGLFTNDQLGTIEIKQDSAFVAVQASEVNKLIALVDNSRLKNKKVRVTMI